MDVPVNARLQALKAKLAARTAIDPVDGLVKAKANFHENVEAIKAEIARIESAVHDPYDAEGEDNGAATDE